MESNYLQSLLSKYCERDEGAFDELFNLIYPKLIQIALAYLPGIVAAQEVVSDVFFKLLKNPQTMKKIKNIDSYLFMAVRNQSLNYLKKNRNLNFTDILDQTKDYIVGNQKNPEDSFLSNELFNLVKKEINNLPPKRKAIFMLVKEEGKKYREVAEIFDISIKTVELQMSLALKSIRKAVAVYLDSKDTKVRKLGGSGLRNILVIVSSLI